MRRYTWWQVLHDAGYTSGRLSQANSKSKAGRTLRAAVRSGDPAMPMLKVCSGQSVLKALRASFMCLVRPHHPNMSLLLNNPFKGQNLALGLP